MSPKRVDRRFIEHKISGAHSSPHYPTMHIPGIIIPPKYSLLLILAALASVALAESAVERFSNGSSFLSIYSIPTPLLLLLFVYDHASGDFKQLVLPFYLEFLHSDLQDDV